MRLTSSDFNDRRWFATVKTRSLIFAILLFTAYIGICSKYAYSYYDRNLSHEDTWSPDTPTNIEHEFTVAVVGPLIRNAVKTLGGAIEKAPEKAPGTAPNLITPPNVIPTPGGAARENPLSVEPRRFELHARANLTAQAITRIADFVGNDAILIGILDEIGYSPPHAEWKRFPTVIKLRLAHDAAEVASPGGGNDLFRIIAHRLRDIYEGVGGDPVLKGFLTKPPKQSIQFAERNLSSSFNIRLPMIVTETINSIAKYCDGGMPQILEGYLGVKDSFEILISSTSNSEALSRAFNRLAPADGHVALKKIIIERLGWKYESAAKSDLFSKFMALPIPDYRKPSEMAEFRSSILTIIEDEHRVDAQAGQPSGP